MKSDLFRYLYHSNKKWWLLLFAGLLFVACQIDNIPRTDDEYLGEQVYWLLKTGKVKSELGYSMLGYNVYQSIYHKLFIYAGYLSCSLFGWSLLSLRLVTYISFLGFLVIFFLYIRRQYPSRYKVFFCISTIFLLLNGNLLYAAGSFRPEVLIMALGFSSYLLLQQYIGGRSIAFAAASGTLAGLCAFAHLNGGIFIIAGLILLLSLRKLKAVVVYSLAACIAFAPYFADVLYHADLPYFWQQFRNDPILAAQSSHWYDPLLRLLGEHQRFLFSVQEIIFTTGLVLVLVFAGRAIKARFPGLLRYTLVLILALAILCPSKSAKYMVLYLPFLYLILIEGWRYLEEKETGRKVVLVRSALAIGLVASLFNACIRIGANIRNIGTGGLIKEHEELVAKIPGASGVNLLGPRIMVFNELGKLNSLQDIELIATENLKAYLINSGIRYVVFSERDRLYFDLPRLLTEDSPRLQPVDSTAHYILVAVKP
jgi:hypothetical protein